MRDALWYGDGTKLNLYYKDEDGKVRTTSVYEVIDAYSECLLGFCISDSEDYEAQYMSYRMAIQVSGHKPYEIVYDNQGGHKKLENQEFFKKLCHIHRTTTPYNGASKTIENLSTGYRARYFTRNGTLQDRTSPPRRKRAARTWSSSRQTRTAFQHTTN